jgi:hypothetical protein
MRRGNKVQKLGVGPCNQMRRRAKIEMCKTLVRETTQRTSKVANTT